MFVDYCVIGEGIGVCAAFGVTHLQSLYNISLGERVRVVYKEDSASIILVVFSVTHLERFYNISRLRRAATGIGGRKLVGLFTKR